MKFILGTFSRIVLALSFTALLMNVQPAVAQHGGQCACGRPGVPSAFEIDNGAPWLAAAQAEFSKWNNYANVFSWVAGDMVGGRNGKNEIIFFTSQQAHDIYGFNIDANTFGITYINPDSAFGSPSFNACPAPAGTTCGTFTETDVIMNTSFGRGWTTSAPNYDDTGPANYGATAVHELGHSIGLHHVFNNLSTMNYYEDFAAIYISLGDAGILRAHYPGSVNNVLDVATYPFRHNGGFQYDGTTAASPNVSSVQAGDSFTLSNFTVENIGNITPSNVRLNIYLTTNTIVSTADYLIGTVAFDTLPTWWDTTGTVFTVPPTVPTGTYYIGGIITYNFTTTDAITYNNSWVLDANRQITVLPCTDAYEPNDTIGAAYGFLPSGTVLSGKICLGTDEDWFKVNVTTPGTVSFGMTPPSGRDYDLQLYNPSGTLVATSAGGVSASESINYQTSTLGTYYARVYGFNGGFDVDNNYTLRYGFTSAPRPHDFNGDGFSDITWRDSSGNTVIWEMNGTAVLNPNGSFVSSVPGQWAIVGQRDFNGDGKADLLWRDTSGNVAIWEMNGTAVLNGNSSFVTNVPTNWSVAGTGDFNADAKGDIVWQDKSGNVAIWEMNGTTVLNQNSSFVANVPGQWSIKGTGDFNGDGKTDILWQDTSGNVAIWEMNGTSILNANSSFVSKVGAQWSIKGTGDFNGDGISDILWQDSSGNVAIWEMNGIILLNPNSSFVANVAGAWSIQLTGDYNGDGKSDIVWHDTSGNVAIWEMNGTSVLNQNSSFVGNVPGQWSIQNLAAE
jgi:FG-GAP-like repeat/Bacterial pre-peptidase C-terminal domain